MPTGLFATLGLDPKKILNSVGTLGLFAIVYAESGIMIGFFLPGDSLLFTAGLLSATKHVLWPFPVLLLGCAIAAILGDQIGYLFGKKVGPPCSTGPTRACSSTSTSSGPRTSTSATDPRPSSSPGSSRSCAPSPRSWPARRRWTYRTFVALQHHRRRGLWSTLMLCLGYGLGKKFPGIGNYLDYAVLIIVVLSLIPDRLRVPAPPPQVAHDLGLTGRRQAVRPLLADAACGSSPWP